jgi:hypothetical protein
MKWFLAFAILELVPPMVVGAIAPAAETVSERADLFPFERIQLTDGVIANMSGTLNADVSQFSFAKHDARDHGEGMRPKNKCKAYPDDAEWPSNSDWETFGRLLGGDSLIKTVPEAAICFSSNGTVANNSTECQSLTAGWGNSTLRYEFWRRHFGSLI